MGMVKSIKKISENMGSPQFVQIGQKIAGDWDLAATPINRLFLYFGQGESSQVL
jgi:hypothetical protein